MKSLVDVLIVTFNRSEDTPDSAVISPSDGIIYSHFAVVLLAIVYLLLLVVIFIKCYMKHELTIPWFLLY